MMSFNCRFDGLTLERYRLRNAVLVAGLLIVSSVAVAMALANGADGESSSSLDLWTMSVGMLGGLALFLFGMEQMADALKALAADSLKDILKKLTTNRLMGAITGAVVTAVIQSSSVTTVLVVGFISAGVLTVSQAVGIIFGANIGSTFTAQLIAFKVTKLALLMVAIGFAMLFISRKEQVKHYGAMIMGLGLVFFGMSLMSDAMRPLRTFSPFINLMTRMEIPVLGILVGAVFTGLIQSSAATTGVVIAMASQGLITLTGGIAIIFGANIGTCVTALLASIGKPRNALRASVIHILFNILGVALWVGFIDKLADLVMIVSPVAEGLAGSEKLAAETPRQIANAHSIFNVANTLIFLPFGSLFARFVEKILPDKKIEIDAKTGLAVEFKTKFIDADLLTVPSMAIEQARNEIIHMAGLVEGLIEDVIPSFKSSGSKAEKLLLAREEEVKYLGKELEQYLIEITRYNLNQQQSELSAQYMDINSSLKHIGKIIRKDFTLLLRRKVKADVVFTAEEQDKMLEYNKIIIDNLSKAIRAFSEDNAQLAREIVRAKPRVVRLLRDYRALRFELSKDGNGQAVSSRDAHLDLADFLRRVYAYSEAIAFTMLEGYLDGRKGEAERPEKKELAPAEAV